MPFFEDAVALDLTQRVASLQFQDVVASDCFTVDASLDIGYSLEPTLLRATDLNRLLPFVTGDLERIVRVWADYILRSSMASFTAAELTTKPALRVRIEGQFLKVLQDRVKVFGVRVHMVRLICRPDPMWLQANLMARQAELAANVRAQGMAALATALGPRQNIAQTFPLELMLLSQMQQGEGRLLPVVDLLPARGSNGHTSPTIHWMFGSNKEVSMS